MEKTLSFGTCYFCGESKANVILDEGLAYHLECIKCPNCGSTFGVWLPCVQPHPFRCLKCLHYWELSPHEEE